MFFYMSYMQRCFYPKQEYALIFNLCSFLKELGGIMMFLDWKYMYSAYAVSVSWVYFALFCLYIFCIQGPRFYGYAPAYLFWFVQNFSLLSYDFLHVHVYIQPLNVLNLLHDIILYNYLI